MKAEWLTALEARAASLGIYTADSDVYGPEHWPLVLLRRLDNDAWCRRVFAAIRPTAEMACVAGGAE